MLKYMEKFKTDYIPTVLLLGNGLNRAYNDENWDKLLKSMSRERSEEEWTMIKKLPYPLMAVVATDDHIDTKMKEQSSAMAQQNFPEEEYRLIRAAADIGVDAILTTDYTYEIEKALDSHFYCKPGKASKYRKKTWKDKGNHETRALYTYMDMTYDGRNLPVWHIHGEAALPDTMIIGHYYYGKLLSQMQSHSADAVRNYNSAKRNQTEYYPESWMDYFLFGNVYVVGQGIDLSEMDLWWLINCKKRNGAGQVHFFKADVNPEMEMLAEAYGVDVIAERDPGDSWEQYYYKVFEAIRAGRYQ